MKEWEETLLKVDHYVEGVILAFIFFSSGRFAKILKKLIFQMLHIDVYLYKLKRLLLRE